MKRTQIHLNQPHSVNQKEAVKAKSNDIGVKKELNEVESTITSQLITVSSKCIELSVSACIFLTMEPSDLLWFMNYEHNFLREEFCF